MSHGRQHDITAAADHDVSGLTDGELIGRNGTSLASSGVTALDAQDAVSKRHTQNTDTALDQGGANQVTAAQLKALVDAGSGSWEATVGAGAEYATVREAAAAGVTRLLMIANTTEVEPGGPTSGNIVLSDDLHVGILNNDIVWDLNVNAVSSFAGDHHLRIEGLMSSAGPSTALLPQITAAHTYGNAIFQPGGNGTVLVQGVRMIFAAGTTNFTLASTPNFTLRDTYIEVQNVTSIVNVGSAGPSLIQNCYFLGGLRWVFDPVAATVEDCEFGDLNGTSTSGLVTFGAGCTVRNCKITINAAGSSILFNGDNVADIGSVSGLHVLNTGTSSVSVQGSGWHFDNCKFDCDVGITSAFTLGDINIFNGCTMESLTLNSNCTYNEFNGGWIGSRPTVGGDTGVCTITATANDNAFNGVKFDDEPSDSGTGTTFVNKVIY
jgi:hypothetical protein